MKPSRCTTVRISVRLSCRDLAELKRRARAAGLSLSAYLVTMALQRRPLPNLPVPDVDADLSAKSGGPPASKSRDAYLQIRVAPEDKAALKFCARQARCSLSILLVDSGCQRPISEPLNWYLGEARKQLVRIGNNVHQLEGLLDTAPDQAADLGQLQWAVKQFQHCLQSPKSDFPLEALAESLRHFGQQLNTTTVLIYQGKQQGIPHLIRSGLSALKRTYLNDEGDTAS